MNTGMPLPRRSNTAALVWGIIVAIAIVGVGVALLIKAATPKRVVVVAEPPPPPTTRRQLPAVTPQPVERRARPTESAAPETAALESGARESAAAGAPGAPVAPGEQRERIETIGFAKRDEYIAPLPNRPGRMYQLFEVINKSDKYLLRAEVTLSVVTASGPTDQRTYQLYDMPPGGKRLLVLDFAEPGASQWQYATHYANVSQADKPAFELKADLQQRTADGASDGTVVVKVSNVGTRNTAATRVQIVLLRDNGEFAGYEERMLQPLKAGESRVEEIRWKNWPNYMIQQAEVQVDGLMAEDVDGPAAAAATATP